MNAWIRLLRFEIKNIFRDQMTSLMAIYPIIIVILGAYILPLILNQFGEPSSGMYIATFVIVIILASMAPMLGGAMLGFLLLDHKDENTLISLRVTPISIQAYLMFKSAYTYLLSFGSSFIVIFGVKTLSGDRYDILGQNIFDSLATHHIFIYALVAGLFGPLFGLALGTVSKNKIEGFAYMKSLGVMAMVPALLLIETMQDFKQYVLGIIPIFWPVKGLFELSGLLGNSANLPGVIYMILGFLMMGSLIVLLIKKFDSNVSKKAS
jgi:fluoroquinolone transport system permease protein